MGLPETRSNMENKLTNHVGSACAYVKNAKNIKINDEKDGDKPKKSDSLSTAENKTHFNFRVVDCDFQDDLLILISLNKQKT